MALHDACRAGNFTDVQQLVTAEKLEERVGEKTPLFIACENGHAAIVSFLLRQGAKPTAEGPERDTTLHIATKEAHVEIVRLLLDANATGSFINAKNKGGMTAFYIAAKFAQMEILQILKTKGADLNAWNNLEATPFYIASQNGHLDVMKQLDAWGADIRKERKGGFTPVYVAASFNQTEAVQWLYDKGFDATKASDEGAAPLYIAAQKGHIEVCRRLVKLGADPHRIRRGGFGPMYVACSFGQVEVVKFLIRQGVDMHRASNSGITPLGVAASKGHIGVVTELLRYGYEKAEDLQHALTQAKTPEVRDLIQKYINEKPAREKIDLTNADQEEEMAEEAEEKKIRERLANPALDDRPDGPDCLGYSKYAIALADVLCSGFTSLPVTVGIYAKWGSGKSFLMRKLQSEMKKRYRVEGTEEQAIFLHFNAWSYSGTDNIWAGLIVDVYQAISKKYGRVQTVHVLAERSIWATVLTGLMLFLLVAALIILPIFFREHIENVAGAIVALIAGAAGFGIYAIHLLRSLLKMRLSSLLGAAPDTVFAESLGFMHLIRGVMSRLTQLVIKNEGKVIIFIDDLDRVPNERALSVLEAIQLLFMESLEPFTAKIKYYKKGRRNSKKKRKKNKKKKKEEEQKDNSNPPFLVFLLVDPRIVVQSIEHGFGDVLRDSGVTGHEYLDKLVQIPFTLPRIDDNHLGQFVDYIIPDVADDSETDSSEDETQPLLPTGPDTPALPSPIQDTPDPTLGVNESITMVNMDELNADIEGAGLDDDDEELANTPYKKREKSPGMGRSERKALARLLSEKFVDRNPRRLKRIVNIYNLGRLLLPADQSPEKLMQWILMSEQWPLRTCFILQTVLDDHELRHAAHIYAEIADDDAEETDMPKVREHATFQDNDTLLKVYFQIEHHLYLGDDSSEIHKPLKALSFLEGDLEGFDIILQQIGRSITVTDILQLQYLSFNLSLDVQETVARYLAQHREFDEITKTYKKVFRKDAIKRMIARNRRMETPTSPMKE
eukprot:m.252913 g.252913  ORF g.252913 m.252913 type:complete len:1009 (+) comp26712_c0_seq1:93-3119(+)